MGKDADICLFKDKASAEAELKKLKSGDAYTWHCEAVVAEFPGWGNKGLCRNYSYMMLA